MPRKKTQKQEANNFDTPARTIHDVDIVDEVETMFVPFAHYSIADRAIPSAHDGLKPSQRRILWAMQYSGYTSKKPFVKSSRIVGDVIGSWHPHGDASVYGTMANMVKPYILNVPLVEGKGSFGFIAGDTESAARYTEARMQPISDMFMDDIKYNAVDMKPNFDERLEEPTELPVIFPVLPINGASGIAVGFATNCAPHNPSEIIDVTIKLATTSNMTVDDLMKIVPGPDFPTGCDIVGVDGIRNAYATGKGIIKQRSKYRVQELPRGRHMIEFYEIPYGISPEKIIADINKLRANDTVIGITDVMDLMDKNHPVRIAVYTKSGINATAIAETLLAKSPSLYATFAINQIVLLNNAPKQMSMIEMLECFIDFRRRVIKRRTYTQIEKTKHDKSLQEALATVIVDIDKVIKIVRDSDTNTQVYSRLVKAFNLTDEQAKFIGDMRLIQLKRKDKIEIDKKIKALERELKRLENIVKNDTNLTKEFVKELEKAKELIARPRKSKIINKTIEEFDKRPISGIGKAASELMKSNDQMDLSSLTVSGKTSIYMNEAGEICQTDKTAPQLPVQSLRDVDMNDTILIVFRDGSSTRVPAHELPSGKYAKFIKLAAGFASFGQNGSKPVNMAMVTDDGKVKVLDSSTLTNRPDCDVMNVAGGAQVITARPVTGDKEQSFVFVTNKANLLLFPVSSVNSQGRTSAGVAGIKLANGVKVVTAAIVASPAAASVVTSTGVSIKVSKLADFPAKGRGTLGVRCHAFLKGENAIVEAYVGEKPAAKNGTKAYALPKVAKRDASGTKIDGLGNLKFGEK